MSKLLITGGTSGIGLNFINTYSSKYDEIYVIGRNNSNLSNKYKFIEFDFSIENASFDFLDYLPKFDSIVFSAGYVSNNPILHYKSNNTNAVVGVNLLSQLNLYGNLYSEKKINKYSSVVFVSSLLGPEIGMFAGSAYAASKAGLVGAVKVLAIESARKGIRVNSVAPGMVESPLTSNLDIGDKMIELDKSRYPLGKKYLQESEVSSVINFLLSDCSKAITGQNIVVDRGFTLI